VIVIAPFADDVEARKAGRRLAGHVPRLPRITFQDAGRCGLGPAAAHAAASRTAARGALAAIGIAAVAVALVLTAGLADASLVLALGAAVACTGAPFAGGLAGFTLGLHRWSAAEPVLLPWDPVAIPRPVFLAVRTLHPDSVASMLAQGGAPPVRARSRAPR
jgi:hypothetical protein